MQIQMFVLISSGHIFVYKTTAPSYKALTSSNNGVLHKLATLCCMTFRFLGIFRGTVYNVFLVP